MENARGGAEAMVCLHSTVTQADLHGYTRLGRAGPITCTSNGDYKGLITQGGRVIITKGVITQGTLIISHHYQRMSALRNGVNTEMVIP